MKTKEIKKSVEMDEKMKATCLVCIKSATFLCSLDNFAIWFGKFSFQSHDFY